MYFLVYLLNTTMQSVYNCDKCFNIICYVYFTNNNALISVT